MPLQNNFGDCKEQLQGFLNYMNLIWNNIKA